MSEAGSATPPPARRGRPVLSCLECRRKKLKCDRTQPCQQCLKIGRPGRCEYQAGQEPEPSAEYSAPYNGPSKRQRLLPPAGNNENEAALAQIYARGQEPTVAKQGVIEDLQERVIRLEHALLAQTPQSNGEPFPSQSLSGLLSSKDTTAYNCSLDKPLQISSQFSDACMLMTRLQHDANIPLIHELRANLKDLQYSVEINHHRQRTPPKPASMTTQSLLQLPSFEVSEKLAVLYFDNMEHCFRVLHWPTFRDQLSVLFTEGEHACKFAFVPQLVGVLAVAVLLGTHEECEAAAACSTVKPAEALHFMKTFLQSLRRNERYRLPALQVKMLVFMCGWLNLEPFDDLFRLNGELLRDALVMKMDQDPTTLPDISVFEGELRRRIWMTIVECDLMLSILCKLPCMVPPYSSDYPRNVNDDEIFEGMETLPASRPTEEWTDGLCQFLLAQSFPRRATACSKMDNTSRVKAEDILPYTRYLEGILQDLPPPLRFNYLGDKASKTPARLMARMELDISIRRPLMHLYSRCVLSLDTEDVCREVRAGFLQCCLMIVNYQDLFDPQYSELNVSRPQGYWDFFYSCYRQELGQATLGLCLEIKNLSSSVHADGAASTNSVPSSTSAAIANVKGLSYTKENLINAVDDTLEPMRRRLPYRASKVKDIVYFDIIVTSLRLEQLGQDKEAMIMERLQHLVRECRTELERAHVPIIAAPVQELRLGTADGNTSSTVTGLDPLWEGFPNVDIFEPFNIAIISPDTAA